MSDRSRIATGGRTAAALVTLSVLACGVMAAGVMASVPAPRAHGAIEPPKDAVPPGGGERAPIKLAEEGWRGKIKLPGAELVFGVWFEGTGANAAGKMDIPAQGVAGAKLVDLTVQGTTRKFTMSFGGMPEAMRPVFEVTVAEDGQTAKGTMFQAGGKFHVELQRLAEGEPLMLARPQEPKRPLPYAEREVKVVAPDGAEMGATLTIPEAKQWGPGPHPGVVLITGSGVQDRDEALMGHRPFYVLADRLTRAGLAVLRVDDRGFGGAKDPAGRAATTDTFAGDVRASLAVLAEQPGVDPQRLGLVGHSEGGVIAPMVAGEDERVRFIVMLAGTGVTGAEVLKEQNAAIALAGGASAEDVEKIRPLFARVVEMIGRDGPEAEAEMRVAFQALVRAQMGVAEGAELTPEQAKLVEPQVAMASRQFSSPWMRRFVTLDPAAYLRRVRVPVLALFGSLDMQVLPSQNEPAVRAALAENKNATIETVAGVNHLFQPAKTGSTSEYAMIETTMDEAVLARVASWLQEHAKVTPPGGAK